MNNTTTIKFLPDHVKVKVGLAQLFYHNLHTLAHIMQISFKFGEQLFLGT